MHLLNFLLSEAFCQIYLIPLISNSLLNPIVYGRTNKEFKRFFLSTCPSPLREEHSRSRASSVSGISIQNRDSIFKQITLPGDGHVCQNWIHQNGNELGENTSLSCRKRFFS